MNARILMLSSSACKKKTCHTSTNQWTTLEAYSNISWDVWWQSNIPLQHWLFFKKELMCWMRRSHSSLHGKTEHETLQTMMQVKRKWKLWCCHNPATLPPIYNPRTWAFPRTWNTKLALCSDYRDKEGRIPKSDLPHMRKRHDHNSS